MSRDAGLLTFPQERWPNWSNEKGWLILTPLYTTSVEFRGERHPIVIDGFGGQIVTTAPPYIPLVAWLVALALCGALLALLWWGATTLFG